MNIRDESSVTLLGRGGVTYAGPDATQLFRAITLRSALKMLSAGITPTRGMTKRKALAMCKPYTGQDYKNTAAEIERAQGDLTGWIESMKSAMPVIDNRCSYPACKCIVSTSTSNPKPDCPKQR